MAQRSQSKQPPGPRRIPPLDDLRTLQQSPLAALEKISRDYGAVVRYPLGPLAVYLANHPDHARHVLQDNSRNYSKDTFQYNLLKSVTGEGLLTSDGDTWLRQRRLSQPAFHPERFIPERSAGRPRFAYFPFGGGPRLCIGNTFALLEAQVVLSQVASRYRLELLPGQSVEVEPGVTLRPRHGLQMTIKPR
jgi:cytochrome P450